MLYRFTALQFICCFFCTQAFLYARFPTMIYLYGVHVYNF